ncbi:MAG: ATP-grasp domain-containing protein [Bdellovibrionaceae bacterium]|jgi:3-methylcrotonyl-CoA carboxylase alpha subunit|nr:ATP-grasp domain-containing protein [Pseudobdellovibrionaceae bacterium]
MRFQKVAINNRGEVAVRIIHACQELGLNTVLLHSEADRGTLAYRLADECVSLEGNTSAETYLHIDKVIAACQKSGAQALHPGFGFLSENHEFVRRLNQAGIIFIGPDSESMRQLGDKVECKKLAEKVGVPLIPGYQGDEQSPEKLAAIARDMGLPVLVKAAAGGGGRGMKLITQVEQAVELIESAQREAQAAFGNPRVFLEKYLDRAKHVEVQIFVDSQGHVVHLFERECSVQRRHQKIIEEAPSAFLSPELAQRIHEAAKRLVGQTRYRGAATVEFLVQDGAFYLLEVNTRLQVEHPVTEEVVGIDLVKAQILTAGGEYILRQEQVSAPRGHAIECRIYAENPYAGGIPSTGIVGLIKWPHGPHRRFESGLESGDTVTAFYDPMIAKVIVWDETRQRAIEKMHWTLRNCVVLGVHTNIPYLLKILEHPEYQAHRHTTRFIEQHMSEPLVAPSLTPEQQQILEQLKRSSGSRRSAEGVRDFEESLFMRLGPLHEKA